MISFNKSENFVIEHINLTSSKTTDGFEISEQMVGIVLNEGISDGLSNGSIVFCDNLGILKSLKISGNEFLNINFHTPTHQYNKTFEITRIERCTGEQQNSLYVKMFFQSVGYLKSLKSYVSKSFNSIGVDTIAKELLNSIGRTDLNIEPTMYNKHIVFPNLPVLECVDMLTHFAISTKNDPAYYFFESDKINFVSLSDMTSKEIVGKFVYHQTAPLGSKNAIYKLYEPRVMNIENSLLNGSLGISSHVHDISSKSFKIFDVSLEQTQTDFKTLNENSFYEKQLNGNQYMPMFVSGNVAYKMNGMGGSESNQVPNYQASSRIRKNSIGFKKLFIEIAGALVRAGDMIEIVILDSDGEISRNTGKWLVQRAVHNITQKTYFQELEIISDSNN